MQIIKWVLSLHFEEQRSGREIARRCGISRTAVARCVKRFRASGLAWPAARTMDDHFLEADLYDTENLDRGLCEVNWREVDVKFGQHRITLLDQWKEWIKSNPGGMSYPTWCRHFKMWKSSELRTIEIQNRLKDPSVTIH